MNGSILNEIKRRLGIEADYNNFDGDIISFINSALSELDLLGVGPEGGLVVQSSANTWDELYTSNRLNMVVDYIYKKVKLDFDPPPTGALVNSYKENIKSLEWKINVVVDSLRREQESAGDKE